jgi:hypothetical protein
MEEGIEKNGEHNKEEIFSKSVRAGKRTYFFDVKATKGNDYYLTITESKKRFGDDGKFFYEKHKLFLYKEDFDKFAEGLTEAVAHIKSIAPAITAPQHHHEHAVHAEAVTSGDASYSDVSFDDLGK